MDLGLYQSDVAKQLGVSNETINNWENGHSEPQITLYPLIIFFLGYNPNNHHENTIAGKLYAYRCFHGLSQKALGKILKVDASTVRTWERNKSYPKSTILEKLNIVIELTATRY